MNLRDSQLKKISELHPAYDPLQYPLLFPHGTQGYSINMPQQGGGRKLTMMRFTAYHIMAREGNNLIKGRRLYQQYLVDAYCKVETSGESSPNFVPIAIKIYATLLVTDGDTNNVGQLVVLPATFHGGPRYMHERQMDAMAYIRKYGRPDLFVTMTTNPKWDEVTSNLLPGQEPQDRPELISRVFALKLMKFLKGGAFGQLQCWLYSIEFQKRGLPHMHILLWLSAAHKIRPDDIDKAISAEFPCPQTDPELHAIVTKNMVHGPCGVINRNSPCMQDGVCKKGYPKCHVESTQQGDDAYPRYRRRSTADGGHVSKLKMRAYGKWMQVEVDNTWVVPYNPWLLRQLHCHVNIEMCTSVKAIKYVLKYVTKGCDQAVISLQQTTHAPICNEIDNFQHGRYVGSSEAAWRILAVHLGNGQRVYFTKATAMDKATDPAPRTTLTDFFRLCREDEFACTQLYADLPAFYTWDKAKKVWK